LIAVAGAIPVSAANVLNVPGSYPTIQAAIDASVNGDTVVVAPGTYFENVNFKGKLITVQSAQGPRVTTIDGGNLAPVVNFSTAETAAAVLQGFTLQHGNATGTYGYEGAGVHINSASPTVVGNVITANTSCADGVGISIAFASPTIRDNTISGNTKQTGCSGQNGGGIYVRGAASAQIIHNSIFNNTTDFGGGISLFAAGTPTLLDNTISNNNAGYYGGGIYIVNQSDATIVQNLITGNTSAGSGGGLYISPPSGTRGPLLVNNTLANNSGAESGLYLTGFDAQVQLVNNIVAAATTIPAVLCDTTYSSTPPVFDHNDLFNSAGAATQGSCLQVVGTSGNISSDPRFFAAGDFHLQGTSPAIDAGNSSAPSLPATDLGGMPRISGVAVDQGAYEFQQPIVVTMTSLCCAVEGAGFSAVVAHFSGGVGPYTASIAWGDGQTSPGSISALNANAVSGTDTYSEEGAYTVNVTITDSTGATATGSTSTNVADAAIALTGVAGFREHHKSNFTATVATLTDADPSGTVTDYTGQINWGDGTTSPCPSTSCTISVGTSSGFTVSGSHNYRNNGTFTVTITITDAGGSTSKTTTTIVVT
jgi:parallel beta-helix repeat protein